MQKLLLTALAIIVPFSSLPASARTWYILPDGTGDAPTIHAGIDSASAGDIVLVACGTFYEHEIWMKSGITLRSETGNPDCVTIDAECDGTVLFCSDVDNTTSIDGFTITHGLAGCVGCFPARGGGMYCWGSSPTITNCTFRDNVAHGWHEHAACGGGLCCFGSSPAFVNCIFFENSAFGEWYENSRGGAIACIGGSSPTFVSCVIYSNGTDYGGGGIYCLYSSPTLTNCILSNNSSSNSGVIYCDWGGNPTLTCCDLWGNQWADWAGHIEDQYGINGNFSECPRLCDPYNGDFHLQECSPCIPEYNPECGLIGAYGVGCPCGEPTPVERVSWGQVKNMFRE
ncbi:MAG: right-handed parallel beta-helix repeat-containing protein [Candidatus Eisenbacteria sp.]|nr:right-handed parallel beta-helix repeat-containing protein [Candidatus Eisenbacteria bacterium]